jgi:hypothetical protein
MCKKGFSMKKQLFIFSFAVAMISNVIAFDERSMFDETNEESKWTFVENKFITKPAAEKAYIWKHLSAGAVAAVAIGAFVKLGYLNDADRNDDFSKKIFTTGNVLAGLSSLSAVTFTTSALECYLSARANRNAVADFFTNWDQNQFFVPAELQDAFDTIAETIELEGKEVVLKNADEVVSTVEFLVMRHFEKRYEKLLQITAVSALNDNKTATEIFKNIIGGTKDLGGSSK